MLARLPTLPALGKALSHRIATRSRNSLGGNLLPRHIRKNKSDNPEARRNLQSAGVDLPLVIAAVCRNFNIDEMEMASKILSIFPFLISGVIVTN
jgi:hypothetical protein